MKGVRNNRRGVADRLTRLTLRVDCRIADRLKREAARRQIPVSAMAEMAFASVTHDRRSQPLTPEVPRAYDVMKKKAASDPELMPNLDGLSFMEKLQFVMEWNSYAKWPAPKERPRV